METDRSLYDEIVEKAKYFGADLVKVADADCWAKYPVTEKEFWPQQIWPWCTKVIVMAVPLPLPIIETTPSAIYAELYNTTNRLLDNMSYQLADYLMKKGYRAIFFPRDCYGDISVLVNNPAAAFSHVLAGYYAGMGTMGYSHNLVTKEYGPRIRLVSVLTDAPLPADPMLEEDLCIDCGLCERKCPNHCFTKVPGQKQAAMDRVRCAQYHAQLKKEYHFPCGICATVCPVGDDRKRYKAVRAVSKEGIATCQKYGSLS